MNDLYSRKLTREYNCAHFVAEAWEHETGVDIRPILDGFLLPLNKRYVDSNIRHKGSRLPQPLSPCLVLLRRVNSAPHVGMFVRNRVFHLTKSGPVRQTLGVARIGYRSVKFYAVHPPNN